MRGPLGNMQGTPTYKNLLLLTMRICRGICKEPFSLSGFFNTLSVECVKDFVLYLLLTSALLRGHALNNKFPKSYFKSQGIPSYIMFEGTLREPLHINCVEPFSLCNICPRGSLHIYCLRGPYINYLYKTHSVLTSKEPFSLYNICHIVKRSLRV